MTGTTVRRVVRSLAASVVLLAVATPVACAQSAEPRKSQHGVVAQTVGATTITVTYFRPVAHGRELFGGIVQWGREWTPGADTATTIAFTTPVHINGAALNAGVYSIWCRPGPDKWTVIFSSAQPVFHIPYPGGEVMHVDAVPRTGQHMETLAFYFPVVDGRKAELVLHWGTVVVPLAIEVP